MDRLGEMRRISVMSVSPMTVACIAVEALGARIIARIQTELSRLPAAEAGRDDDAGRVAQTLGDHGARRVTAIGLRDTEAGRMLRGIGALAVTICVRSTGWLDGEA